MVVEGVQYTDELRQDSRSESPVGRLRRPDSSVIVRPPSEDGPNTESCESGFLSHQTSFARIREANPRLVGFADPTRLALQTAYGSL